MALINLSVEGRWDWEYRGADEIYFFNAPSDDFDLMEAIRNLVTDFLTSPEGSEVMDYFNLTDIEALDLGTAMEVLTWGIPDELFAKYNFSLVNPADKCICGRSEDKLFDTNSLQVV